MPQPPARGDLLFAFDRGGRPDNLRLARLHVPLAFCHDGHPAARLPFVRTRRIQEDAQAEPPPRGAHQAVRSLEGRLSHGHVCFRLRSARKRFLFGMVRPAFRPRSDSDRSRHILRRRSPGETVRFRGHLSRGATAHGSGATAHPRAQRVRQRSGKLLCSSGVYRAIGSHYGNHRESLLSLRGIGHLAIRNRTRRTTNSHDGRTRRQRSSPSTGRQRRKSCLLRSV